VKFKLTPWFPITINPVRIGVYDTKHNATGPGFAYWNGEYWAPSCDTVRHAMLLSDKRAGFQNKVWRGVAK
jgi:hypothetical protein